MKKLTALDMVKKIVLFCCIFLSLYTLWNAYEAHRLNIPISDTLTTCVFAFWGTEMCLTMAKKIIEKKFKSKEKPGTEPGMEVHNEVDNR